MVMYVIIYTYDGRPTTTFYMSKRDAVKAFEQVKKTCIAYGNREAYLCKVEDSSASRPNYPKR